MDIEAAVAGPKMRVSEILAWRAGSVISTGLRAGETIDILRGRARIGAGELSSNGRGQVVRMVRFGSQRLMEEIRQVLGVVVVLGLLGGALWWLRGKGLAQFAVRDPRRRQDQSMKVVERLALTPQHSLHLVRVAERTMLVAASPGGCSLLDRQCRNARKKGLACDDPPHAAPFWSRCCWPRRLPWALPPRPANSLFGINMSKSGDSLSVPMQIVILLTLLTLLPAVVMSITPFLRIAIVLHFLRQALGTQTTPSNQVLLGLSLFLTM